MHWASSLYFIIRQQKKNCHWRTESSCISCMDVVKLGWELNELNIDNIIK